MAGTQIFVRNRQGQAFGPIEPSTVELLIESGALQGLLQVSTDGEHYALPFRFPELRDFFPRHLWGDDSRKDVQLDADAGAVTSSTAGPPRAELFGGPPGNDGAITPPPRPVVMTAAGAPTLTSHPARPASPEAAANPARAGDATTAEEPSAGDDDQPIFTAAPLPPPAAPPRAPAGAGPPVLTSAPLEPPVAPAPPPRAPAGSAPPVLTSAPLEPPVAPPPAPRAP